MSSRKKLNLNTVAVDLGCSCSRPKLSLLFHPKSKIKTTPKPQKRHSSSSSSSSTSTYWSNSTSTNDNNYDTETSTSTAATPLSPNAVVSSAQPKKKTTKNMISNSKGSKKKKNRGFGRVGGEGVAVEKESDDPYLDFRQSMLQMILENEIYSKDHLRELLNCFLSLNSPSHHAIIVRAFSEIWDGVFSVASAQPQPQPQPHLHCYNNNNNMGYYEQYCCYNDQSRDYFYNYNNN